MYRDGRRWRRGSRVAHHHGAAVLLGERERTQGVQVLNDVPVDFRFRDGVQDIARGIDDRIDSGFP